jgi:hypothetical protein
MNAYDALDHQPLEKVIRSHGLRQTLAALAELLSFHAQDTDEPMLRSDEKEIAEDAVQALSRLVA